MEFPDDWTNVDKMNYLQRKIILNSMAYYMYNVSPLSDRAYDEMSKQLVEMQKVYWDEVYLTQYGYAFHDFDGTTGFDLYGRLLDRDKEYLEKIAIAGLGMKKEKTHGK